MRFCQAVDGHEASIKQRLASAKDSGDGPVGLSGAPALQRLPNGPGHAVAGGETLQRGVCLVCSDNPHKRANAVFLACAYAVLVAGMPPQAAVAHVMCEGLPLMPFRDASFGLCSYTLTLLDCLNGLAAAVSRGIFRMQDFDVEAYERDEALHNGDINWIVPGLFAAFSGPLDQPKTLAPGRTTWTPAQYVQYFKAPQHNITLIIRLNKACYDKRAFTRAGVRHGDLFYPDGGLPPAPILARFISLAEKNAGAIGVHCKAGLGRTGTCIGAYMMKHYRMTAREVIAWMRICRPGSVLGPQQQYLESLQPEMWSAGEAEGLHERWMHLAPPAVDLLARLGVNLQAAAGQLGLPCPTLPTPALPRLPLRPPPAAWASHAPWVTPALDVYGAVPHPRHATSGGEPASPTLPFRLAYAWGNATGSVPQLKAAPSPVRAGTRGLPSPTPMTPPSRVQPGSTPGKGGQTPQCAVAWLPKGKGGTWVITPSFHPLVVPGQPTHGRRSRSISSSGVADDARQGSASPGRRSRLRTTSSVLSDGDAKDTISSPGSAGSSGRGGFRDSGKAGGAGAGLALTPLSPRETTPSSLPSPDEDLLEGSLDQEIRASLAGGAAARMVTPAAKPPHPTTSSGYTRTPNHVHTPQPPMDRVPALQSALAHKLYGASTPSADVAEGVTAPGAAQAGPAAVTPPPTMAGATRTPQGGGGPPHHQGTPGSGALPSPAASRRRVLSSSGQSVMDTGAGRAPRRASGPSPLGERRRR